MSILSNITDTTPIAVQRSTRNFARGVFRVINNFVAAIIAERERQANLAILRNLSDRELWDIGIARSQIGAGLAEAAKERALLQKSLAERSAIKRMWANFGRRALAHDCVSCGQRCDHSSENQIGR